MAIDRSLEQLTQLVIDKAIERDECTPTVWEVYEEVLWKLNKDVKDDEDNIIYISVRQLYREYLHID